MENDIFPENMDNGMKMELFARCAASYLKQGDWERAGAYSRLGLEFFAGEKVTDLQYYWAAHCYSFLVWAEEEPGYRFIACALFRRVAEKRPVTEQEKALCRDAYYFLGHLYQYSHPAPWSVRRAYDCFRAAEKYGMDCSQALSRYRKTCFGRVKFLEKGSP